MSKLVIQNGEIVKVRTERDDAAFLRECERRSGEPLDRMRHYIKMFKCFCSSCVWLRRILGAESKP